MGQGCSQKKHISAGAIIMVYIYQPICVFFANSLVPFFYTTRIEVVFSCPILLHHRNRSSFPLSHSFTSLESRTIPTYLPFYMPGGHFSPCPLFFHGHEVSKKEDGQRPCKMPIWWYFGALGCTCTNVPSFGGIGYIKHELRTKSHQLTLLAYG